MLELTREAAAGLLAGLLAIALLGGAVWLWWDLPKWQLTQLRGLADDKAKADVEDNFRKTIGQLLGGAVVLIGAAIGATFTYLQFSQQQQASHELLISTQVSKGFELLGSNQSMMQLGGIYALEGVMKTSEQYHQPALETLCAFVRDRTKTETGDGPPFTEIQAALTVIGRRTAIETETALPDLKNAHIPRADLRSADLRGAYLYNTDLRHADLRSAYLNRAYVIADLRGAYLDGADLRGATLHGDVGGVDTGADLSGTHLDGADLRGAAVAQAQLDRACGTNVKLDPGLTIKRCP
jgi:uncharacterized protein YjbI with pentapeptide repeats